MSRVFIGQFKGAKGETGDRGIKGDKGEKGDKGDRGSRITRGTAITGTSTNGTKFPNSGISDAKNHDYYINENTGNLYECIVPGNADTAEWAHAGSFKGPKGDTGPAGSISNINEQKPTYTEAAVLTNISSGETVKIAFGKLKKALSVLMTHYVQQATASVLGHVKLSNSAAVTQTGQMALDAVEKNASVAGTLANQISQVNSNLPAASWGNVTVNTNVVSNGAIQYQKYGNICIVYFAGNVSTTNVWTDYKLASRLPPVKYGYIPMGIFQHQDTQKAYIATVAQEELYIRTENEPPSGWMRGSITYVCN